MKGVIRLGDSTSHGGKVIAASGTAFVHGIAVARKGDACVCPINGHSPCVIAEGDPMVLVEGIPVAFQGHKTSCGATLTSSVATSGKV
ncbi:PAAR domain-containing protein [Massilia sp. ZL223]|uniref:PAAR domain-containing protein n=1 Tax=Massilia sp. ZL223 TaxID=2824904 RepID=UPI001B81F68C|nr:PAAR domain-containing protein [Massilia sp. ZL223]MBQ5962088.1 PAAR domain-containing protein [Massilia sp. ZL223]